MLIHHIGTPAMLEQTAEECVELAHACLKLSRKLRNENPTKSSEADIMNNLHEELADVLLCIEELESVDNFISKDTVGDWIYKKHQSIKERVSKLS